MNADPSGQQQDDESAAPMRLRADPPRVTRLSRRFLMSLGLLAGLGIGGALIYALQTRAPAPKGEELYSVDNRTTADGLAGLPRDYAGPLLGPPLPGDLGRAMLDVQNRGQAVPAHLPEAAAPAPSSGMSADEQRRFQELEAARTGRLFASTATTRTQSSSTAAPPSPSSLTDLGLAPQPSTPSAQDRKLAFLNGNVERRTVSAERLEAPASPYTLQAGSVIAAAMITGIRSDLPGQVTAQVTENIYDSPTGRILLIPQGTRLVGAYDSSVDDGQRRVLLVWNRLLLPSGRSIVLERQPGADAEGYAGLEDDVDYHWGNLAKAAGLSTLLSVGAELAIGDDEDSLLRAVRNGTLDTINSAGQKIVDRELRVPPTLTIRPGFPVRVIVTRDLVLEPYKGN